MGKPTKSLDAEFFNKMYKKNDDPWDFENSPYEREKYEVTLRAIRNPAYGNVFEIGCSNGVLSEKLARRCTHLLAVDTSEIAIKNAAKRLADEVHELFIKSAGSEKSDPLLHLYGRSEGQYRLDLFEKKTEQ